MLQDNAPIQSPGEEVFLDFMEPSGRRITIVEESGSDLSGSDHDTNLRQQETEDLRERESEQEGTHPLDSAEVEREVNVYLPEIFVTQAQYAGLVSMFRLERRKRRRLEAQLANIQEQMSVILNKQIGHLSSAPSTITGEHGNLYPQTNRGSGVPDISLTLPQEFRVPSRTPVGQRIFTDFDSYMNLNDHVEGGDGSAGAGTADEIDYAFDGDEDSSETW